MEKVKDIKFKKHYFKNKSKPVTFKYRHENKNYMMTITAIIITDTNYGAGVNGSKSVRIDFIDDYCDAMCRSSNGKFISPRTLPLEVYNKFNEMIDAYEGWVSRDKIR